MAKITIKPPDDLIRKMQQAETSIDSIADEALRAGGQQLASEAGGRLDWALAAPRFYPKRSTGELRSSFGVTPMKIIVRNGSYAYDVKVGFGEPRARQPSRRIGKSSKGGGYYTATNAMVANILEHGHRGSKHGQTPAPWWDPALKAGRKAAEDTVRRTVEDRLDEIFKKE